MDQFSNFTYIKQIPVDLIRTKFNMSYRLNCLLEEQLRLADYGNAIKHIFFSPLIGEVFPPISKYIASKKTLEVQFLMNPQQAIELSEAQFFSLMRDRFLQTIEMIQLPKDFDFKSFKKDVQALQFEQLKQAA